MGDKRDRKEYFEKYRRENKLKIIISNYNYFRKKLNELGLLDKKGNVIENKVPIKEK